MLTVIGQNKAVLQFGKLRLWGFPAWTAWVFVHISILIQFRNRYKVMAEWAWHYVTNRDGVRLISGQCPPDLGDISGLH